MTLEEYTERLKRLSATYADKAKEAVFVPAANELLATIKNRIVQDGKNSQGSNIGQYSTEPAYFSKNQFVKKSSFKGVGQRGFKGERIVSERKYRVEKVTLKSGKTVQRLVDEKKFKVEKKAPKSMYIDDGYKGLRDIQGRRTDVMNLSYSGATLLAYQMTFSGNDILLGMTNTEAAKIRQGQEKKRGKIFYATKNEIEDYNKNVREESEQLVKQIFG